MAGLLDALLANESGNRNIANTTQGTSSGPAQGYFQITTGTWKDFGGDKFAPTPLQASYQQQAEIASKIPLKRWDESTVARMQATGKKIDPNLTLGENLTAAGENIMGQPRVSGPLEAAGGGGGSDVGATQLYTPPAAATAAPAPAAALSAAADVSTLEKNNPWSSLANGLASSVADKGGLAGASTPEMPAISLDVPTAIPPAAPVAPIATDTGQLADIFKVGAVGQAAPLVDQTGRPRKKRDYG